MTSRAKTFKTQIEEYVTAKNTEALSFVFQKDETKEGLERMRCSMFLAKRDGKYIESEEEIQEKIKNVGEDLLAKARSIAVVRGVSRLVLYNHRWCTTTFNYPHVKSKLFDCVCYY